MGRIISGYNRLFIETSDQVGINDETTIESLKNKALSYVENAFQNQPKEQATFLLSNTKTASVQANVSLILLCDEGSTGKTYRDKMTTLNGYESYPAASEWENFYCLCLLPDVPEITLSAARQTVLARKQRQKHRFEGLLKGIMLMTNYLQKGNNRTRTEMENFKIKLQTGNGVVARTWALNGIYKNATGLASKFSLHQRVSLLRVLWNEYQNLQQLHTEEWITTTGYDRINGNNPEHFHYYADIANDHRLAIDAYVKTNLSNEEVKSQIQTLQTKKGTIPRTLSVCSWKYFLPVSTITNFVNEVCNGGIRYMYHNNKYIRMAKSPEYPLATEFFLSSKKFPCDVACTGELQFFNIANDIFNLQNALLEDKEKAALIQLSKTQPVNVMMTTISKVGVSCGFTEHNDWARLLASLRGEVDVIEDGATLPQRHLMQVLTISFVWPVTKGEVPCVEFTINWKYNDQSIGKITTTGNFAHLQLFGINDNFLSHEIKYEYRGVLPNAVRIVLTFRRIFSCDPCNRIAYDTKITEECNSKGVNKKGNVGVNKLYKHRNVVNKLLGIADSTNDEHTKEDTDENTSSDDEKGDKPERNSRVTKRKVKFAQLKPNQYKTLHLPRPAQPQCLTEPMGNTMGRSAVVLKLIREENILLYRHYGILQNKPGIWVKEDASMYEPGEQINMEETALNTGIVYNSHQHNFAPSDPLNDGIFMFGYKPKNDCPGLKQTYDLIQKGLSGEIPEDKIKLPEIFTFGSGGNPNRQGTNAPPKLHRASKRDAAVTLQTAQSTSNNNCNSTAKAFLQHEFLVAVIVNDYLLGINKSSQRGNSGRYLFLYEIINIIERKGLNEEKYWEHVKKYGEGCKSEEFRFLQDTHIMITMQPAVSFSEYMSLYRTRTANPFKRLYFPWDTEKRIVASNLPNMVTRDGVMRHQSQIYDSFVNSNKDNFIQMASSQHATDIDINSLDLNGEGVDFVSGDMSLKEECYRATAGDLVMCCILISAANAYRHLGQSLAWVTPNTEKRGKGKQTAKQNVLMALPLVGKWQHWYLGVTNQCIPINSPNRSFDVIVLLQQYIFNKQHNNRFRGKLLNPTHNGVFSSQAKTALFVAIVTRFTGNPTAILHYESYWNEKYKTNRNKATFLEPTKASVQHFIAFLRAIKTGTSDIGYVVSNKHRQSFYPMLKNNLQKYSVFLIQLANGFKTYTDELWSTRQELHQNDMRAAAVDKTKRFLADCIYSNAMLPSSFYDKQGKGLPFLSHACLADWEELFYKPVGEITFQSVKMGPGGESAIELVAYTMGITTQEAADEILRVIRQVLPDNWLTVLGFKKIKGIVYSATNWREVGYSDIDQTCCKFYLLVISTHPTRTGSETPNADKPHCEPVRTHEKDSEFVLAASNLSTLAQAGFEDKIKVNEDILRTCVNDDGTENEDDAERFEYTYNVMKGDTPSEQHQTFYYHVVPDIPMMPGEDEYVGGKSRRKLAEEYLTKWKHDTTVSGRVRTISIPTAPNSKRKTVMQTNETCDSDTQPTKRRCTK